MTNDLDEIAWWGFQLPEAFLWQPGASELDARARLKEWAHKEADVDAWPLVRTRVCSRAAMARSLEGK